MGFIGNRYKSAQFKALSLRAVLRDGNNPHLGNVLIKTREYIVAVKSTVHNHLTQLLLLHNTRESWVDKKKIYRQPKS